MGKEELEKFSYETSAVTREEFEEHKKTLKRTQDFVWAILAVFFLTFILLMIDAWRFHGNQLKELKEENIELKINQIINSKLNSIKKHSPANFQLSPDTIQRD